MKNISTKLLFLLVCAPFCSKAQDKLHLSNWKETPNELVVQAGKRNTIPVRFKTYFEDTDLLRTALNGLPTDYNAAKIIDLPTPDGDVMPFRIWQTPMMEPALAAKYSQIKTFTAEAVANRNITAKIDITPAGFHAMVFNGTNTFFIDPYSDVDNGYSISYYKKDAPTINTPSCTLLDQINDNTSGGILPATGNKTYGSQRRTYRLALACTYEYAVAVAGATPTKANVLAAMVLIMNRVNGVYERDLASTMTLVANNDTLLFITASEPYTNNDGNTMLGQNISTCDARIGNANYDIGHVFSTGGGGVAYLGVLCNNSLKGGGVTGLSNPVGDAFAIDYVAHEMGHQFGSNHTFNSSTGACSGNIATALAFEPGSGSTIMAYAGICGSDDLQPHSDPYFHAGSLRDITAYITTSTGNICPVITTSPNTPNTYPDFTHTYNIPNWTPFELTAPTVTDATADTLTYCWEEWDLGGSGLAWNANNDVMPFFRSFNPSFSPTRTFPAMNSVLAGTYSVIGERLPYNARTLKFILTTRDIYQGYGAFNSSFDTDTITVNTFAIAGATDTFKVTSQATTASWDPGSTQTITWNVGTAAASPISATNVNIYLSVDSAKTFPYLLASNMANNGSATVTIPSSLTPSNKARIKIKPVNNVFFAVNKGNITITNTPLSLLLTSFNAVKNGCGIDLRWTLANNDNIVSIYVERSNDAKTYQSIAQIPVQQSDAYTYKDADLKNGMYLYRIRIVEKNEVTIYSNAITTNLNCNKSNSIVIFPNPAKDLLNIQSSENINKICIFTAAGQKVETKRSMPNASSVLDVKDLANGVYILQITTENGSKQNLEFIKE